MVREEFEKMAGRPDFPMPDPIPFPADGLADEEVFEGVGERLRDTPFEVEKDFSISYVGPPHPISKPVAELAAGTYFTEWAREVQPGAYRLEKEAVRMLASLLGRPEAVGFITNGGTESNVAALRLARNLSRDSAPEVILPESAHYSFRVGAELLGLHLVEVPLGDDFLPDMNQVEDLINEHTIALVCSAPDGAMGVMDPVEEFAELAHRKELYLHVDGAFGGFIYPFMRDLGIDVPRFDFSLPGVSSIMTDGHKLGLMPIATGFFLVRDEKMLDAIPTHDTLIHNLTATKSGERAAVAWAVMQKLGRSGYVESVRSVLGIVDLIVEAIERIDGLRLVVEPFMTLVNFTSDEYDVERIHRELSARGWGSSYGVHHGIPRIRFSVHPHRDREHAMQMMNALEEAVAAAKG